MIIEDLFKVHNIDARKIKDILNEKVVDVTITSPPYFDLKDYGSKDQIGFGQNYEDYLNDLKLVFEQVYKVTKDNGTLWVIIDAFKRDGEVVTLPFDFSNKLKETGWKLQEVIIWGKDRTLPWAHKGQMRNIFEYILVFSKRKEYNFYIDTVRDHESLKKWWIKYPERYNPKGKTPDAIWNFEIPTQGSWGKGYIRHFCPLPEEMIAQMLRLTTKEEDVVLDCFSGSGAVLSKADNMNRKYIGFELNKEYIQMFENYLLETGEQKRKEYYQFENFLLKQEEFENLILNLRVLKYAKLLYKKLNEKEINNVKKIFAERTKSKPLKKNSLIVAKYVILLEGIDLIRIDNIKMFLDSQIIKSPLSKFGIEPEFKFVLNKEQFRSEITLKELYIYTNRITHKFHTKIHIDNISALKNSQMILSNIKVDLDERDYE